MDGRLFVIVHYSNQLYLTTTISLISYINDSTIYQSFYQACYHTNNTKTSLNLLSNLIQQNMQIVDVVFRLAMNNNLGIVSWRADEKTKLIWLWYDCCYQALLFNKNILNVIAKLMTHLLSLYRFVISLSFGSCPSSCQTLLWGLMRKVCQEIQYIFIYTIASTLKNIVSMYIQEIKISYLTNRCPSLCIAIS